MLADLGKNAFKRLFSFFCTVSNDAVSGLLNGRKERLWVFVMSVVREPVAQW
jgi:hypothetical protein